MYATIQNLDDHIFMKYLSGNYKGHIMHGILKYENSNLQFDFLIQRKIIFLLHYYTSIHFTRYTSTQFYRRTDLCNKFVSLIIFFTLLDIHI